MARPLSLQWVLALLLFSLEGRSAEPNGQIAVTNSTRQIFSLPPIAAVTNFPPRQIFTLRSLSTNAQFVPEISGRVFTGPAHWAIECPSSTGFGLGVAAGDFYGHGYPQLAVGMNRKKIARAAPGCVVFLSFHKAQEAPQVEAQWPGELGWKRFGVELAAGDVNGDGFADLLAGMPEYVANEDLRRQGLVRLYFGASNGVSHFPYWEKLGEPLTSTGRKILLADLNRDGHADALVGGARVPGETNTSGQVELFLGQDYGLTLLPVWSVRGAEGEALGTSLAVGDVNGDGWPDILLGAPSVTGDNDREGKVKIFFGSATGFASKPDQVLRGTTAMSAFGESIAALGDLNGDRCADIVVGAPGSQSGTGGRGAAYLFLGSRTGVLSQPSWQARGWRINSQFGKCVARAGDVNGDGIPDLLVGAPCSAFDGMMSARVSLWLGKRGGFAVEPDWQLTTEQGHTGMGTLLGCAGDLDGDGLDDFFVSSPLEGGRLDVFRGLRRGYGAGERFPADGKVCIPEDRSLLGRLDVRKNNNVREVASRIAEAPKRATVANAADQPHLTVSQKLWLGASASMVTVGALLGLRRARREATRSERERMARDLHDDLGAGVHRLQLLTERLNRTPAESEEAKNLREQVFTTAQSLSGSVDRAVWAVKPDNDTIENLVTFLASYAPSVLRPSGIECRLELPTNFPNRFLPGNTRQNLFLAVNEALHNVIKHSQAKSVTLRVVWSEPWLELAIEDDGTGKGVELVRPGGGNGLGNLSARMEVANGTCIVAKGKTGGTNVVLRLSLASLPRNEQVAARIQRD